jgi:large subunit ribosomal protein L3
MRLLVEFRDATIDGGEEGDDGEVSLGQQVTVKNFEAGQKVKVAGITIGKGFQGTVKRHNFGRGPVSHGSHNVRAPGSIGASAYPARVFKGMRLPGQMGNRRATQKGLEIADIDAERNLLLIKGSVPGSRNSIVEIRTDG